MTAGHEIPSKNVIADFFSTVDAFLAKDDARIIGKTRVHPWPVSWIRVRKYLGSRIRIRDFLYWSGSGYGSFLPSSKIILKNLDFFCDFFMVFRLEDWCKCMVPSKSNQQKNLNFWKKVYFCFASWKPLTKRARSGSGFVSLWYRSIPKCHGSTTLPLSYKYWR